jgi:hypothetical protein
VCTTVTTTRKVFSVLLSIFTKGHPMSNMGWAGLSIATAGKREIRVLEIELIQDKFRTISKP